MQLRILTLCVCCFPILNSIAQPRLNYHAEKYIQNLPPERTTIDLFVKGKPEEVKQAVKKVGGNFKYGYDVYNAVTIPLKNLGSFLEQPAVKGVQNGETPVQPLTDTAIIVNCVLPVHNGDAPLDTSYKGDGVIMGIIDYGIDINHDDFKKSNGETRIRYLWDQHGGSGNSPLPYSYGREWSQYEIDSGLCTHTEPLVYNGSANPGHGTTVAGIAAGNGRACNGRNTGMAPNTDMIVVALNFNPSFLQHVTDAVDYIFKKADAMGKPCVINASVGAYWGPHDGKDFGARIIDALLEERAGRVFVCAAGNAGHVPFHLGYDVTSDTSHTWFHFSTATTYFDFWADTQELNNVYFAVGTEDPPAGQRIGISNFFNIKNDFVFNMSPPDTIAYLPAFQQRDANGNFLGTVVIGAWLTEGRYNVSVDVTGPTNVGHYWSLITTGSGRIDGWNSVNLTGSFDMVTANLPPQAVRPDMAHYRLPDLQQTTTSSFTCSPKAITVGNFINRWRYQNIYGNWVYNPSSPPGMIFGTSSRGPTRDGRIKPDISATGDFTLGTGNAAQIAISSSAEPDKVGFCGKYFRNGGTSMASPIVAGVAALYLQRNPNADWEEVKQAIISTAKVDSFVLSPDSIVPNNAYGYGKVQACDVMLYNAVFGCMDSTADNYDSLATIDDGSCLYYGCTDSAAENYDPDANFDDGTCIIYGCMDSTADNYLPSATVDTGGCLYFGCTDSAAENFDPAANVDDGSCTYVGIGNIPVENISLEFVPNFFKAQSRIIYDMAKLDGKVVVIISNLLGQTLDEIELMDSKGEIMYRFPSGETGIFFYRLENEGKPLLSGKIIAY